MSTIKEAANQLAKKLIINPYYTAIGVTDNEIIIYAKNTNIRDFKIKEWQGYPVVLKKMGTPRALGIY